MFDKNSPYNDLPLITSLEINNNAEINKLAEDTRVAIEVLNYAVNSLPSANILLDTLALQEAKASSNIENIVTTNDDLYKGVVLDDYTAEAKEVANYKDALFIGFEALKAKGILSPSDIEKINEPVNLKNHGIRVNLDGFSDLTRIANKKDNGEIEILYTPPHGKELIQKLLIDMLEFIYNDETYQTHPLIKIALSHYQFESIHPFRDGNGRTGRILNVLFLCQKQYLSNPVLYASSYIIKHKNEYYKLLNTAHEKTDHTEFIRFMLNGYKETAEKTLCIVENIKKLIEEYTKDEFVNKLKGQKKLVIDVINLLFKKVYVRISDIVELGVHRQTASEYLNQFVDCGLLEKNKVGKDNIYKNIKLLELFEED